MRLAALVLLPCVLLLAGCDPFGCNQSVPASCPAPRLVAADAGAPDDMASACAACIAGAGVTCEPGDGGLDCRCARLCE